MPTSPVVSRRAAPTISPEMGIHHTEACQHLVMALHYLQYPDGANVNVRGATRKAGQALAAMRRLMKGGAL